MIGRVRPFADGRDRALSEDWPPTAVGCGRRRCRLIAKVRVSDADHHWTMCDGQATPDSANQSLFPKPER